MSRFVFAAVFASALAPLAAGLDKTEPPKKNGVKLTKEEQEVVDLTNAERKAAGLPALTVSPELMVAAREHAANMAKAEQSDHFLNGTTPDGRAKAAGFKSGFVGENIAWNQKDAKQAVGDWMNSPGHKDNILKKAYTDIGVGVARTRGGEPHWVQVFGKR